MPASDADVRGLPSVEAESLLKIHGYNELPRPGVRSFGRIVVGVVGEPMFALLLGAGGLYLALGDLVESLVLIGFAFTSVLITVVQETRSERVLEALRDLTSPRALVIRDGAQVRIPGRDVVPGDVIVLGEGDRVPADAVVMSCSGLEVDESLLTGESLSVKKRIGREREPVSAPGGDDTAGIFAGTLVVRGRGLARVAATGARSEIGKIGRALGAIATDIPLLRQQTARIVRIMAAGGFGLASAYVVLYALLRGGMLKAFLGGVALMMSMLPEEFPLVLSVFMVMGAWRISRARVLTRRATAIETLGAATVFCTDKTGTLTLNRMAIAEIRHASDLATSFSVSGGGDDHMRKFTQIAVLASYPIPSDPMDRAIHETASSIGVKPDQALTLHHEYSLTSELPAVVQVWQRAKEQTAIIAAKGAPEAIALLCHMGEGESYRMRRAVEEMGAQGERVLGLAYGTFTGTTLPQSPRAFELNFVGLLGFSDPLRPGVAEAIGECRSAGIRIVMITGDYPRTAAAIARDAGLDIDVVTTGADVDAMSAAELSERVRTTTVFARTRPEHKLRIVDALKANGEIVAMTGDGVNDAPSLKSAHIGIAMGGRGTDVAREAADLVLLDDDFGSVVRTIRLGRRIYDNLRKSMSYIIAVHVPIAGLSLLPVLFGLPLILAPLHIALLEMVIDPTCSLAFEAEPEERNVMNRPPRDRNAPIISRQMFGWSLFQGALAFLSVAAVFIFALRRGMPEPDVRALAFISLVLAILALIVVNRSFSLGSFAGIRRRNPVLWIVMGVTTTLLILLFLIDPVRELFKFGTLHPIDLAICALSGALLLAALVRLKPLWRGQLVK